jgi:hypothetical protein
VFPGQPLQRPSYFLVGGVVAEVAPRVQPQASVFRVRVVEPLQECLPVNDQALSGFLFELRARSPIEHEDAAPGHEDELGTLPRQRAADLDTHPEIACSQKAPVRAWGCPLTTWSGLSGSSSGPAMYWTSTREPTIRSSARVLTSGLLYSSRRVVSVDHLDDNRLLLLPALFYSHTLPTRAFTPIVERAAMTALLRRTPLLSRSVHRARRRRSTPVP